MGSFSRPRPVNLASSLHRFWLWRKSTELKAIVASVSCHLLKKSCSCHLAVLGRRRLCTLYTCEENYSTTHFRQRSLNTRKVLPQKTSTHRQNTAVTTTEDAFTSERLFVIIDQFPAMHADSDFGCLADMNFSVIAFISMHWVHHSKSTFKSTNECTWTFTLPVPNSEETSNVAYSCSYSLFPYS